MTGSGCVLLRLHLLLGLLQRRYISEEQLRYWLCQLLLALEYLQVKNVVHRDIKTSNVMLTAASDVQLGDFGLATYRGTGRCIPKTKTCSGQPRRWTMQWKGNIAFGSV
jgi:serine/threonine protein kinase